MLRLKLLKKESNVVVLTLYEDCVLAKLYSPEFLKLLRLSLKNDLEIESEIP